MEKEKNATRKEKASETTGKIQVTLIFEILRITDRNKAVEACFQ